MPFMRPTSPPSPLCVTILTALSAGTSRSFLGNLFLVLAAVASVRCWWSTKPSRPTTPPVRFRPRRYRTTLPEAAPQVNGSSPHHPHHHHHAGGKHANRWRDYVRSSVVEHAWETLCGSIVQEFIYDTWYCSLTPDREFPAEVRRILNHAFGQGAARARGLDLRLVMEDASELLMEQLELYRDTRDGILADKGEAATAFINGTFEDREQVLKERMAADGNLHPALLHPDGNYRMLRAVSEGVVGLLLDPADYSRSAARAVARELLSGCVFRPLMMWCTPYNANKGLYYILEGREKREQLQMRQAPEMDAARSKTLQGHWEFEQRVVRTKECEKVAYSKQPPRSSSARETAMPPPPPRPRQHTRSRSHDDLSQAAAAAVNSSSSCPLGPGGPPGAQPARFWSETQGLGAPPLQNGDIRRPKSAAATTTPPPKGSTVDISENSTASRASTMSTTSPVRQGPSAASNGHHVPFVHPSVSLPDLDPEAPGAHSLPLTPRGHTMSNVSSLMRPSPFDDLCTGSFTGTDMGSPSGMSATVQGGGPSTGVHDGDAPLCRPSPADSLTGFVGVPRARVVAADLNSSGTKDVVVYVIRVGDDSGREWTVCRRYKHFEVLHRQLRGVPTYRSKLPPKRIFIHSQNEDFVEERRHNLDGYIQEVLSSPLLARSGDVWEFLRAGSERFEVPGGDAGGRPVRRGFGSSSSLAGAASAAAGGGGGLGLEAGGGGGHGGSMKRGISRTVIAGATSVGRGMVEAAVDVTRGVSHGVHGVTNAAVDGVGAVINEAKSLAGLRNRRSISVPDELQEFDPSGGSLGGSRSSRQGDPLLLKAGSGIMRTATASAKKVRSVLKSHPSQTYDTDTEEAIRAGRDGPYGAYEGDGSMTGSPGESPDEGAGGARSGGSGFLAMRSGRSLSPNKHSATMPRKPASARPPRGGSPVKSLRRAVTTATATAEGKASLNNLAERSAAFAPGFQPPQLAPPGSIWDTFHPDTAMDTSGLNDPGAGPVPVVEVDAFGASSPMGAPSSTGGGGRGFAAGVPSPGPYRLAGGTPPSQYRTISATSSQQLDLEAYAGISAPLYELVDCLFQLQTRGFFRRQVYAMARQVLSMAIGDTIDVYLQAKLSLLRQESTIGQVIQIIQSSLWPGGVWFQRTPQFKAAHPEEELEKLEKDLMSPTSRARGGPGPGMQPELYLEPSSAPPLDSDEVREAVWALLMRRAPTALVRLVGRTPYNEGVQDLYELMQSPTFMRQLGYGLLEIGVLHLCPELKDLFQGLEHNPDL